MTPIRIVVVDDSPLIRQILVDMLRKEPDFEVVGYARDGEEALLRIAELSPDVVTLDVDMPRLDGVDCLKELMATRPVPAIMVSALAAVGAQTAFEALLMGAVDVVCKPDNGSISTLRGIREELVRKVRHARNATIVRNIEPAIQTTLAEATEKVVLIAGGAGCPRALSTLFQGLPQGFQAPVLVVPHIPAPFIAPLVQRLNEMGAMPVREAREGDHAEPGVALVAPGGHHLIVGTDGILKFDFEPPVHGVRPAADPLFVSAAKWFGERAIGVVLTGGGCDGADGAMAIRRAGGTVFAESEATTMVYEMPEAAVANGAVDRSIPIQEMGEAIAQIAVQSAQRKAA